MSRRYDVVVIGAGHNGLVAAAYLARAGRRVLVLERRPVIGGATVTIEAFPGFRVSDCADGAPRLLPRIVHDLALARHGLRVRRADPVVFAPQPDGDRLVIWNSDRRTAEELARRSRRDAERYPRFATLVRGLARLLGAVMQMTPPNPLHPGATDLLALLKVAARSYRLGREDLHAAIRMPPMSVADLAQEWFESEPLRAAVAAAGVTGITWGPSAAGTAYTLLHGAAGGGGGVFGPSGVVVGGMGAVAEALATAARRHGAEIRTGTEVAEIIVDGERAAGVVADGGRIDAGAVVSTADPRTTYLRLLDADHLDPAFVHEVRRIKYRGSCARVHLALAGLPTFAADGDGAALLRGRIRIAPTVRYLERAYDDAKYGRLSSEPYVEALIPTLTDPGLAPDGRHLLSAWVQYAPYHLRGATWDEQRDALGELVLATLARYAPGIDDLVLERRVVTPLDLERDYALPEGNPHHGELTLDQLFYMRPVPGWARYRAPVPGLYLAGAGSHPGGGVTGAPGANAAREVARDLTGPRGPLTARLLQD